MKLHPGNVPTLLSCDAPGAYRGLQEPYAFEVLRDLALRKHSGVAVSSAGLNAEQDEACNTVAKTAQHWLRNALTGGLAFDFGSLLVDPHSDGTHFNSAFYRHSNEAFTKQLLQHPFSRPYVISYITEEPFRELLLVVPTDKGDNSYFVIGFIGQDVGRLILRLAHAGDVVPGILEDSGHMLRPLSFGFYEKSDQFLSMQNLLCWDVACVHRALWILEHEGSTKTHVGISAERAKNRRRLGRPPIPSYTRVTHNGDYSTPIKPAAVTRASEDKGGTHASPIEHARRGHFRVRAGKEIWVRPCTVNPGHGNASRTHYEVRA